MEKKNNTRLVQPGIVRENRISAQGLQRLEKHLAAGTRISRPVLAQWISRYGEAASDLIQQHGYDIAELKKQ